MNRNSLPSLRRGLLVACFVALVAGTWSASAQQPATTLYQCLGGYDGIAAITDDLIRRMVSDPVIGHCFAARSVDSRRRAGFKPEVVEK